METRGLALALALAALLSACAGAPERERPVGRSGYLGMALCPAADGVEVSRVSRGSPAARAGLKTGDFLTQYDGLPLSLPENRERLLRAIRSASERRLELGVKRGQKLVALKAAPALKDVYAEDELYQALSEEVLAGGGVSVAVIVSDVNNARPEFFGSAQALEAWKAGMKSALENSFESLLLNKSLLSCPNYAVADRDKTAQVLKELDFQMTGAVAPETAKRLGKLVGASHLLFVSFSRFEQPSGGYLDETSARLVEVESDRVRASVRFKRSVPRS